MLISVKKNKVIVLFIIIFSTYSFAMTVSVCSVSVKITRCSETPDTSRFSSRTTSSFRCSESNGNRNTVSSVASLQCFDAVGWFLKSVWCMRIESYQVSKQLYRHRLQNKHTDGCNRYSFVVFKTAVCCIIVPILTVLPYDLSLFPRYYREDRPHPVIPLSPSPCSFPYRRLQFCFKNLHRLSTRTEWVSPKPVVKRIKSILLRETADSSL